MPQYYKPGLSDSILTLTDAELNKKTNANPDTVDFRTQLTNSGYVPYTGESSLPGLNDKSVVQNPGAENKSTVDQLKNEAGNLGSLFNGATDSMGKTVDEYLKRGTYENTDAGKTDLANVIDKGKNAGTITPDEQARIDAAGTPIAGQFDVLINQATEKARQGRASNLVAAAKSGGLDASAWAGISALVGEKAGGPAGFEGIGGKLAAMGSEYDAVVSSLGAKKVEAVAAAKNAERQAVLTGKSEDWKRVTDMYKLAQQAYNDQSAMLLNKTNVLNSYQTYLKTALVDGENQIKKMVDIGVDPKTLTPEQITKYENAAGLQPGSFTQFWQKATNDKFQAIKDNALKQGKEMWDIAKDLPVGQSYTIKVPKADGTTEDLVVKGTNSDKNTTEIEAKVGGTLWKIAVDKQTGKELWRINTGKSASSGSSEGKTITWQMVTDLGLDATYYGKPISELPKGYTPNGKDQAAFDKEAADLREKLSLDQISWPDAYNSLRQKYNVPDPKQGEVNIVDKVLNMQENQHKTGAKASKTTVTTYVSPVK